MKNIIPNFTLQDIQIDVGDHEFQKGLQIYQNKKINNMKDDIYGYSAEIEGTDIYQVYIQKNSFDRGSCNCYLGQKDILCKHMIALAIAAVYKNDPSAEFEVSSISVDQPVCSGDVREITKKEIDLFKEEVRKAMTHIRGYSGPSSKWFQYQHSLAKGSRLILLAVSKLPICEKSVLLCVNLLKRLDKKLTGPVDDSDGTVSNLMFQIVEILKSFTFLDKNLEPFVKKKLPESHFFEWQEEFKNMK